MYSYLLQFSGKTHSVCTKLLRQWPKSPFSFAALHLREDMDQAVTYMRRIHRTPWYWQGESFIKLGPANQKSIGDIRRVSNWVFSVSSYILVLGLGKNNSSAGTFSKVHQTKSLSRIQVVFTRQIHRHPEWMIPWTFACCGCWSCVSSLATGRSFVAPLDVPLRHSDVRVY